ncbi:MAG: hypothetical protein AAF514_03605, partial [Verrucomicrobiota bacterium]
MSLEEMKNQWEGIAEDPRSTGREFEAVARHQRKQRIACAVSFLLLGTCLVNLGLKVHQIMTDDRYTIMNSSIDLLIVSLGLLG